jgi:hypothetical protein
MSPENPSELTPEEKAIVDAETAQNPTEQPILSDKELKAQRIEKGLALVEKLKQQKLPYPGIPMGTLTLLTTEYDETNKIYRNFTKSPSKKVKLFKKHGIKIVTGNHPKSGNIFVLPANMDNSAENIEKYSILVQILDPTGTDNPDLKELIELFTKK